MIGIMTIPIHNPGSSIGSKNSFVVFTLGFRPFFLAAGVFAVLLMVVFVSGLISGVWHYNYFPLFLWHAHEMIFGYAAAVVAGFLLTAVRNWTGMDTATGNGLLLLLLIWLAGRFTSAVPVLPGWLIASVDILFLPLLALVILRPIVKSGQYRNVPVPLILLLMAVGNALIYAEMLEFSFGSVTRGVTLGISSVLMLISVIGGRVMPFFTERGLPGVTVVRRKWIEQTATPLIAFWLLLELIAPHSIWGAVPAFAAATVHGIRLSGWSSVRIWREPMLWMIHMAYGWLVAGFILQGITDLGLMQASLALHAWTVGTIGMFTLGLMARVSLGHTGRAIAARPAMVAGFVALALAAVLRVIVPLLFPAITEMVLLMAATGWIVAFVLFIRVYAPYLVRPRADGRNG